MMGLSVAPTPAAISDALSLINAMLDPQQAKRTLEELGQKVEELNKAHDAAVAQKAQADADRAAADKLKAELDAHEQDLASREQQHNTALAELAATHDKVASDMASLDVNRRSANDDLTRREVAVAARENAVTEREQKNADEAATLKTMRMGLEDRLAKIRALSA